MAVNKNITIPKPATTARITPDTINNGFATATVAAFCATLTATFLPTCATALPANFDPLPAAFPKEWPAFSRQA